MKHMQEIILWNDATVELPDKSGIYLVITANGRVTELVYSAVHKLWNADDYEDETALAEYAIPVLFWAYLPELWFDVQEMLDTDPSDDD